MTFVEPVPCPVCTHNPYAHWLPNRFVAAADGCIAKGKPGASGPCGCREPQKGEAG